MKKLSPLSPFIPLVLLIALIASWIELDLYAPSFPQMMHHFHTNEQMMQWTLSCNFLGFFVASLLCGSLADSFGRRKVLIAGSLLFALGSVVCLIAPDIWTLILGRLIQGIGVSAPVTVAIAVVADLYQGERQVRILSLISSCVTIMMAAAPVMGVFLTEAFGWRSNFIVIALGAFISGVLIAGLIPETLEEERRRPFSVKQLFSGYFTLLRNSYFISVTICLSCFIAAYFVFIGIIPLLFMEQLGVDLRTYGFYQGAVVGLYALLSLSVSWVIERCNVNSALWISICIALFFGVALLLLGIFVPDNPFWITLLMCMYVVGLVLPGNVLFTDMMDLYPDLKGSCSSLFQSLRMLMMAFATYLAGWLYDGTFLPVGAVIAALTFGGFVFGFATMSARSRVRGNAVSSVGIAMH